jgi:long-chain acyl-CoA synthetase
VAQQGVIKGRDAGIAILNNVLQAITSSVGRHVEYAGRVRVSPLPLYHIFAFTAGTASPQLLQGFTTLPIRNPRDPGQHGLLIWRQDLLLTGINSLVCVSLMAHPGSIAMALADSMG